MIYKIDPFPAVRVNGRNGRFTKRAKEYHNKMNELRALIGKDKEKIIKQILSGDYQIIFYMKMPENFSEKKKALNNCNPHKIRPDIDNLYKAFIDTLFHKSGYNDKEIFEINCCKCRGGEGGISITDKNGVFI